MVGNSNGDSSRRFAIDVPPHQIPKGLQGAENDIPLSPQWLSPKPGDNKLGIMTGESHFSLHHGNHFAVVNSSKDGEVVHDSGKWRDVFRPSEIRRRDSWHDEERELNSAIYRDRWREGDKESGDTRKVERWSGRYSRNSGEVRRFPSERWDESSNREGNYDQRRASKWSIRRGPEDKVSGNWNEKWLDTSGQGKDNDREYNHYSRSGRSNSTRTVDRGEPAHPQFLTPDKQSIMSTYGRGRGEDSVLAFSAGRGRPNSSTSNFIGGISRSYHFGTVSDQSDGCYGDSFRYDRMKMIEIYRMNDVKTYRVLLDEFVEVTSLTREEPLEPLALSSPTPEELVILEGIDKGDLVSSIPPVSKDVVPVKQNTLGYREDMPAAGYNQKDHNTEDIRAFRSESFLTKTDAVAARESSTLEVSMPRHVIPRRSPLNDIETGRKNATTVTSSYYKDEQGYIHGFDSEMKSDSKIRRQSSEVFREEIKANTLHVYEGPYYSRDNSFVKHSQPGPAPEDLSLYYKDPRGQIQGPFSGNDLIEWLEAGFFGVDLQVRLASAAPDAPFLSLGDVMPHLQTKPTPPPGFGVIKQSNMLEMSNREKYECPVNFRADLGGLEVINDGQRSFQGANTEAENRFLESLMSSNITNLPLENISLKEGMQGHTGSDANYLLAQRRLLEPQRSLPNPLSLWSGRDSPSIAPNMGIFQDSSTAHSMMLPQIGDTSRQVPQIPQSVDLLSVLNSTADKSPQAVNSGGHVWSNFLDVRSQNFTSQFGFGVQQMLQSQNQASLSHLINQPGDTSFLIPPEISQDPRVLSLLQQQHLLPPSQMQPQVPVPTQLPLLDRVLLLKQQQEQQHLLLQQQQQFISQVLSRYQTQQHFGDPSYGQFIAALQTGNTPVDSLGFRQVNESLPINQQMNALSLHDIHTSNLPVINLQGPQNFGCSVSSITSPLNLPHQIVDHAAYSDELDTTFPPQGENISLPNSDTLSVLETTKSLCSSDAMQNPAPEVSYPQKNHLDMKDCAELQKPLSMSQPIDIMTSFCSEAPDYHVSLEEGPRDSDLLSSHCDQVHDMKISSPKVSEQYHFKSPVTEEVANVESHEVKRTSEKKSRKQKKLKSQTTLDLVKGSSKEIPCQRQNLDFGIQGENINGSRLEVKTEAKQSPERTLQAIGGVYSIMSTAEAIDSQQAHISSLIGIEDNEAETIEWETEGRETGLLAFDVPAASCHLPWKPAPGVKPKSLVEIQLEEQQRSRRETMVACFDKTALPANSSSPTSWLAVGAQMDHKPSKDVVRTTNDTQSISGNCQDILDSRSMKSQLHDLLSEEVLCKSKDGNTDPHASDCSGSLVPPLPANGPQIDISAVDDDFIEAKVTKKSRKKASKGKSAGVKTPSPVDSFNLPAAALSREKVKNNRQAQLEKESSPFPPAGPSFGDFVLWKEDQANSSPVPAWSSDSGKLQKPTSLRDIQKEQEKKIPSAQQQITSPTSLKVQSNHTSRGSPSWQVPGSSPSKAASMQTRSLISSQSNSRGEDDMFWSNPDQQETNHRGGRIGPSVHQKSSASRTMEQARPSLTSPVLSLTKGKRDQATNLTEAMDFRDWCESESIRLTGTNDTSFLEFCLNQSTQEAEMLLRENLASLDINHQFIDKFLNYKDFLSHEVIEMAFRVESGRNAGIELEPDGSEICGGKRKGKKVKKVSPSVLGFSVISNRIMMGEIQSADD